jgi:hypothetical protein
MSGSGERLFNNQIIAQGIFDNLPVGQLKRWKVLSKFQKQEIEFNLRKTGRLNWAISIEDAIIAYQERLLVAKKTLPIFRDRQQETDIEAEMYDNVDFSRGDATL